MLAAAPGPEAGKHLTIGRLERLLRRSGRQRYVTTTATTIHTVLHTEQLQARPGVGRDNGAAVVSLVRVITARPRSSTSPGRWRRVLASTRTPAHP